MPVALLPGPGVALCRYAASRGAETKRVGCDAFRGGSTRVTVHRRSGTPRTGHRYRLPATAHHSLLAARRSPLAAQPSQPGLTKPDS
ncbi:MULTISPECIES: hypothetical protein [unclassified Streptomyces]|uniref:hypothetical protein n=1 Tax=unclassified Streptomyces TaxID=2593676 RepID=UPI00381654C3